MQFFQIPVSLLNILSAGIDFIFVLINLSNQFFDLLMFLLVNFWHEIFLHVICEGCLFFDQ